VTLFKGHALRRESKAELVRLLNAAAVVPAISIERAADILDALGHEDEAFEIRKHAAIVAAMVREAAAPIVAEWRGIVLTPEYRAGQKKEGT
jgi:hypothetical protein